MIPEELVSLLGMPGASIEPFSSVEDGSAYQVWKVTAGEDTFVLKKAKGYEMDVYSTFFSGSPAGAPRLLRKIQAAGEEYFLMEYGPGEDLCRCDREKLTKALDALIELQDRFWEDREKEHIGTSFEVAYEHRRRRGAFLRDPELEAAYGIYLSLFERLPRTLCHDDLLPFNVLVGEKTAVLIDWECAGILPYPTSLARLIAHGEENEDAFFYMKEADKAFAIDYYFENLIRNKGISYADYRRALDYCLLYEYCEWIMLGNRYPDADMVRYQHYLEKAKAHIRTL